MGNPGGNAGIPLIGAGGMGGRPGGMGAGLKDPGWDVGALLYPP